MNERDYYAEVSVYQRSTLPPERVQLSWRLGLLGETGEVCDVLKKALLADRHRAPAPDALMLELGDVYWYVCALSRRAVYCADAPVGKAEDFAFRAMATAVRYLGEVGETDAHAHTIVSCLRGIAAAKGLVWGDILHANAAKLKARTSSPAM